MAGAIFAPNLSGALYSYKGTNKIEKAINPFSLEATETQWDLTSAQAEFARRFGLSRLGLQTKDLALALTDPATQLKTVLKAYETMTTGLTGQYQDLVAQLKNLNLPDEEVVYRADAYIKPQIAAAMELLRLQYPYAVGGAAGGGLNPIEGLAHGIGSAEAVPGVKQFQNVRDLKRALKAAKAARAAGTV